METNFCSTLNSLLGQGVARLPHAILLTGPAGVGKSRFAELLAAMLLCESPGTDRVACGGCQACRWLASGNHPDFRRVAPDGDDDETEEAPAEKTKKRGASQIRIDQIRDLEGFVFVGSHREGNRVVLLSEAEAMNPAAANALLKILEEPPPSVYFILVSSRHRALLPTIRSRCRVLAMPRPDEAEAGRWLASLGLGKEAKRYLGLAGGAPLRVAQWKDQGQLDAMDALIDSLRAAPADPIALASRWDALLKREGGFHLEHLVEGLQRWLVDLALERMTGDPAAVRFHRGWPRPADAGRLDPVAVFGGWRELGRFRRSARHPLNQLLFLESLATQFLRATRPVAP